MDSLPYEIVLKIILYAHPKIESKLKRSIEVTAAHRIVKTIYKNWNDITTIHNHNNWNNLLNDNIEFYGKEKIIKDLKNCGCCKRHSKNICGSHTFKEFHKKKTWGGNLCNCWCRHMIRNIVNN